MRGKLAAILALCAATAWADGRLSGMARVRVDRFRFEGNTVFSDAELAHVVAGYTGREITSEELETARRKLTEHYVARGYLNSGAVIPDQPATAGTVTVRLVEGRLSRVTVTGNRWLRTQFIRDRVARAAGTPLNVQKLRDGLQLLRQDPNVAQINADLQPGGAPGEGDLTVRVRDRQPFWAALQVDNCRPVSVGEEEIVVSAGDRNLTGHGDPVEVSYALPFTESDHNGSFSASYTMPVTARGTTLRVYGNRNDYAVVEEPFASLDITGESTRWGVALRQPLVRTANRELALAVAFERRESRTWLLGEPFSLESGADEGRVRISVVRLVQEWVDRTPQQVVALRSTVSLGVDAFGVTLTDAERDARFWSWLGQAQYVRRLGTTANQLLLRVDGQWTDQSLFSLEQFALGGANTVRGYRENQLVRDRGVYCGAELRLPVLVSKTGAPIVQLAPFIDYGAAWNVHAPTPSPASIASAGVGLLLSPVKWAQAQVYWGCPFQRLETSRDRLQDAGIHFSVRVEVGR